MSQWGTNEELAYPDLLHSLSWAWPPLPYTLPQCNLVVFLHTLPLVTRDPHRGICQQPIIFLNQKDGVVWIPFSSLVAGLIILPQTVSAKPVKQGCS